MRSFITKKTLTKGLLVPVIAVITASLAQAADEPPANGYYKWVPADKAQREPRRTDNMNSGGTGIITVGEKDAGVTVMLGGTVMPFVEVTLSAQIPGRVEYIAGTEGDSFGSGQVLVAIDNDDLLAKRQQALAALHNADAAMRDTRVQFSRELWAPRSRDIGRMPGMGLPSLFDQFFTRGFASGLGYGNPWLERQADLYSSGTGVTQARGQYIMAQSALQEIDARLRDAQAVAPFNGAIIEKMVEVGDTVQPGQALIKFADIRFLQVQVEVPSRLVAGLQPDMEIPVTLDVGNTRATARVAQIFPVADFRRHTVTVKLDLPEDVPGAPGMYVEVNIPDTNVPSRSTPVIPESAVLWRGSLPAVFVVNAQNQTELRMLRLGEKVDTRHVSVLSGLQVGERIVGSPPAGMKSGEQVVN